MTNTSKLKLINSLKRGDSVLIDYTKELNKFEDEEDEIETVNKLTLVLEVNDDKIKFEDSSTPFPFEMSKKYLMNSDLELKIIDNK